MKCAWKEDVGTRSDRTLVNVKMDSLYGRASVQVGLLD